MWENREFSIRLEENVFRDHERIMLSSGECSYFMPMGFVGEEGAEVVNYDCSGFAPLSSYRVEKTDDALFIIECVLMIVGRAVEYFITPARITINTDTVFYNKETSQVKIAYVPAADDNMSIRRNLVSFIEQLKEDICDGKEKYLDDAERFIMYHNYYIRDMINKVGMFKKQLYAEAKQNCC